MIESKRYWVEIAFNELNLSFTAVKCTKEDFFDFISQKTYNLRGLGYSKSGAIKFTRRTFPNKPKNIKICTYLLRYNNKKLCTKCYIVKDYLDFHKNESRLDSLQSICKDCELQRKREEPERWREANAKYKLSFKQRVPKWGQEGIKEFYKNCPKDNHVDHDIPLNGKYVSGLHVLANLRYLPARDNLIKRNYHISEEEWK